MLDEIMRKIVAFLDPKLEKYRSHPAPKKFVPKDLSEFIDVLRRTPKSILSQKERERISAVMSFDSRLVKDFMVKKDQMIFLHEDDYLGPLMLDKLYQSGFTHFPVVDAKEKVKGIIHTESLNTLEIKKTDKASHYLDKKISYLHETDSFAHVVEELNRTNSFYFLVRNDSEELVGFFTLEILMKYLLG